MRFRKDYVCGFAFVVDADNETEPYYVGNSPGKKIGDNVYFRWTDGLFFKRNLFTNEETPIEFLNDMNLSLDTAVGFMDDFIVIEKQTNSKPSIDLFDLYKYDGTKKEADYKSQADEYIYDLICTNLRDIEQTTKKYIAAKENGEIFKVNWPELTGELTLSAIENLYLALRNQQAIGTLMSKNFEKCLQLVKYSGAEDVAKVFHNIITVLYEYGKLENRSVFQETYILELLTVLGETMEKTQFAQVISDYKTLETAVRKLIDR